MIPLNFQYHCQKLGTSRNFHHSKHDKVLELQKLTRRKPINTCTLSTKRKPTSCRCGTSAGGARATQSHSRVSDGGKVARGLSASCRCGTEKRRWDTTGGTSGTSGLGASNQRRRSPPRGCCMEVRRATRSSRVQATVVSLEGRRS